MPHPVSRSRQPGRPNILFLLSDQHRFDFLGSVSPWLRTPNLDRLAASGVRFTQACCANSPCAPSRASLLTSRYAEQHGVWQNSDLLPPGETTWAHTLDAEGYQCWAVGRTHNLANGFTTVPVPLGASHPMINYFNQADPDESPWGPRGILEPSPAAAADFYDFRVADTTCRVMEDLARTQPFCLYAGFLLPHPPCVIPEPWFSAYRTASVPFDIAQQPEPAFAAASAFFRDGWSPELQHRTAAVYAGMVELLDAAVGRILDHLEALGLADNTLVVYTSDHGEQLGHRGLWSKNYPYDPSIRVPLILRHPAALPAGRVSDALVSLVDLGPTLLEAVKAPVLPHRAGRSFLPVAQGLRDHHREALYSSCHRTGSVVWRTATEKFADTWIDGDPARRLVEHYDLAADPGEQRNLAATGATPPARIAAFRDALWRFQRAHFFESASVRHPANIQHLTHNSQFRHPRPRL